MLKKLAREKCFRLFCFTVSDKEKYLITLAPTQMAKYGDILEKKIDVITEHI
jgi:hypothetical protein